MTKSNTKMNFIIKKSNKLSLNLGKINTSKHFSTQRQPPTEKAAALINLFPGNSLFAKTSSILVTSSIAAFLLSKEIYVIDAEFFEMLCIFGAYYIWYKGGKESVGSYFKERKDVFFVLFKDNKISFIKSTNSTKRSCKIKNRSNVFGFKCRHEANVREREQREIVSHVIAKVKADLQNPKLVFLVFYKKYNDLMNQTLLDIEGNF